MVSIKIFWLMADSQNQQQQVASTKIMKARREFTLLQNGSRLRGNGCTGETHEEIEKASAQGIGAQALLTVGPKAPERHGVVWLPMFGFRNNLDFSRR